MEDLASKKLQRDLASNKFAMFLEQVGVHTKGGEKKKKDWSERLEVQMVCFLFILIGVCYRDVR